MTRVTIRGDITRTAFRVCNLAKPDRCEVVNAVVDTGSLFSWVPAPTLHRIGVHPTGEQAFRTINGQRVERQIADALCELDGEKGACPVVFAEEGDGAVVGATALERLGFEVNPRTRKLRHVDSLLAL